MNCPNCKKIIDDNSKFCEFCGVALTKKKIKYSSVLDDVLSGKTAIQGRKEKRLKKTKNFVLVLSIFIIATFLVATTYNLDAESLFISIPITILVVFVYKKLAKKFDL